ncbi:hypothetical protein BS78_10G008000 [Paspalum vaginatum]|nr:hypothetical protein BS78_10G008000 [Paspalum vaginatum]
MNGGAAANPIGPRRWEAFMAIVRDRAGSNRGRAGPVRGRFPQAEMDGGSSGISRAWREPNAAASRCRSGQTPIRGTAKPRVHDPARVRLALPAAPASAVATTLLGPDNSSPKTSADLAISRGRPAHRSSHYRNTKTRERAQKGIPKGAAIGEGEAASLHARLAGDRADVGARAPGGGEWGMRGKSVLRGPASAAEASPKGATSATHRETAGEGVGVAAGAGVAPGGLGWARLGREYCGDDRTLPGGELEVRRRCDGEGRGEEGGHTEAAHPEEPTRRETRRSESARHGSGTELGWMDGAAREGSGSGWD